METDQAVAIAASGVEQAASAAAQKAMAVVLSQNTAISRGFEIMFNSFFWGNVVPMLMFACWIVGQWWMLVQAQKNDPTFRAVDFLRDEPRGKASAKRFRTNGTWILHSLLIVILTIQKSEILSYMLVFYAVIWAGTPIAEKWLDVVVLRGATPPPAPPPPDPQPAVKTTTTTEVQQ